MNTIIFIAKSLWRRSHGKGRLSSGSSAIATISVAISMIVMILALSITDGFKKEVKEKASGFSGEILIHSPGVEITTSQYPINAAPGFLDELLSLKELESSSPYAYRSAIIKRGEEIQGVLIKGVDTSFDWRFFGSVLVEGRLPLVGGADSAGVNELIISKRLASMLGYSIGDNVILYFIDKNVKVRRYVLCGIYDAQLEDIDKSLIVASISSVRDVNEWSESEASGVEIRLKSGTNLKQTAEKIEQIIEESPFEEAYYVTRVDEMFPHLFDWLTLLDFNVLIIMILMISVAGFNMISGLLILLFEKISMIGLLKSLGMRDSSIHKIFLLRSMKMVLYGVIAGNIIAISLAMIQIRYSIIPLDPVNYFVDHVPIYLNWYKLAALNLGAILLIALLLMIPSVFISKVSPDTTLRLK